jgi:hypothetical protein
MTSIKFSVCNSSLSNEIMKSHTSHNNSSLLFLWKLCAFNKILNFIFNTPKDLSMTFLTLACDWLKVSFIPLGGGPLCHCSTWYLVHLYDERYPG